MTKCLQRFPLENKLRLGAQSVAFLSTLRDPTQLRRRQCASYAMSECKKAQIFIAHWKEGIDQTKKKFLAAKKSCLEDFARINGK